MKMPPAPEQPGVAQENAGAIQDENDAPPGWVPFPTHLMPPRAAAFIRETAAALDVDEAFLALPLLALLAGCIGSTCLLRIKNAWKEPATTWSLLLARSGSAKSPAMDACRDLLTDFHREARKAHLAACAAVKENTPEPRREELLIDDATPEAVDGLLAENPRGLLILGDESVQWLRGMGQYKNGNNGDKQAWIRKHYPRSGVTHRAGGKRRSYEYGVVSVGGAATPGTIKATISAEDQESGLLARLFMAWPPERPRRWTDDDTNPVTVERMTEVVNRLLTLKHGEDERPVLVDLSQDARSLARTWVNDHGLATFEQDPLGAAVFSKLEGGAFRFALLMHLARWASGEPGKFTNGAVSGEDVANGVALARWFANEQARIYSALWGRGAAGSAAEKAAQAMADVMNRDGVVQQAVLTLKVKDPAARIAGMNLLQARGTHRRQVDPRKGKNGKHATWWGPVGHPDWGKLDLDLRVQTPSFQHSQVSPGWGGGEVSHEPVL